MGENTILHLVFFYGGFVGSGLALMLVAAVVFVYVRNGALNISGTLVLILTTSIFIGSCVMWWRGAASQQRRAMDKAAYYIQELVKMERVMREKISTLQDTNLSDMEALEAQIESVAFSSHRVFLLVGAMEENFGLVEEINHERAGAIFSRDDVGQE